MTRVQIKAWEIEIDSDRTKDYYSKLDKENLLSCCLYCKNYYYGIRKSSHILIGLFNQLGIVPEKTAHLSELIKVENKHLYDADYLLTGRILKKPTDAETVSENGKTMTKLTELSEGISIHFWDKPQVLESALCPKPILSLQVVCEIPWVLEDLPTQL